jgi:hypothetical protein
MTEHSKGPSALIHDPSHARIGKNQKTTFSRFPSGVWLLTAFSSTQEPKSFIGPFHIRTSDASFQVRSRLLRLLSIFPSKPKPQSISKRLPTHLSPAINTTTTSIFFHDFLPNNSQTISRNLLSAWLTNVLSAWRIWTLFLTPSMMIFEMREVQWRRYRLQLCQHHILEKSTTNKLLPSLNPAVMFYMMSVYENGLKRPIVVRYAAINSI